MSGAIRKDVLSSLSTITFNKNLVLVPFDRNFGKIKLYLKTSLFDSLYANSLTVSEPLS